MAVPSVDGLPRLWRDGRCVPFGGEACEAAERLVQRERTTGSRPQAEVLE
jgi:hypothetical protein